MMENGKRRRPRQLSPEEKWEMFLEVTSQEISQADAARKYGVDVSVIIRLRALAKDAALAAFASARPLRVRSCSITTGRPGGGGSPSGSRRVLDALIGRSRVADDKRSWPASTTAASKSPDEQPRATR